MCPERVTQVIMPNKDHVGKIRGLPIIELRTDKEVVDTHIAIGGERIEIRKKKERPVLCKGCLQFGHPEKYCTRNEKYCEKCAEPKYEREGDNHECRGEYCFYCNKEYKTGDKQKCKEYEKEKEIPNKMAEQRKKEDNRQNQRKPAQQEQKQWKK